MASRHYIVFQMIFQRLTKAAVKCAVGQFTHLYPILRHGDNNAKREEICWFFFYSQFVVAVIIIPNSLRSYKRERERETRKKFNPFS